MNKNYVLILVFNEDYSKLLLVKRNKEPYKGCFNGIGGKIEAETPINCAIRECWEETGIKLINPRLLVTLIYPTSNVRNSGTKLNVIYDCVKEENIKDNYEGHYEWKDISFVMNINNKQIAGLSNLNQFVKEILDIENIDNFYD